MHEQVGTNKILIKKTLTEYFIHYLWYTIFILMILNKHFDNISFKRCQFYSQFITQG